MVSLGCAKNLVDAEIMLGSLLKGGVEVVNDASQADALIVNTCSFIDAAQEESVDTILESAEFRNAHRPGQAVIVSGCLPQRFRDELPKLLPEVDAFIGIDQVEQVAAIVEGAIAKRATVGPQDLPVVRDRRMPRDRSSVKRRLADLDATAGPEEGHGSHGEHAMATAVEAIGPKDANAAAPTVLVHVRPQYVPHWDTPRFRLTPKHFAYVKIAEGCNHPCSFCIIPRMRGRHRSRPQADVVEEARRLIADGVRELNLISQDSTYYGLDARPDPGRGIASPERFQAATRALPAGASTLSTLLRELNQLPGDFWIRLLYTHPAHWTDELIRTIAECPKVARYVDMPLQHIHDDMLARMRRETNGAYIRDLIRRIRAGIPGIALRTTFIVGFPGETRAHFETLLEFIRETRFERLGVFTYSQEDGTVAGRMQGQVPVKTRQKRRELAMIEQHAVARSLGAQAEGRIQRVLVEGPAKAGADGAVSTASWEHGLLRDGVGAAAAPELEGRVYSVARGEADAPDIDGRVYVRGRLTEGKFAEVRIVGHTDYDLIAEPVTRR
ncbi:MAG: 30S ribosomal protein S12 methylthiotransferase RimO [Verrucomicrobiales bacterium]|nr:30S ribosomal protein S12 methylthiotransferase RimO [Verrucomicrobiales bacterium]